MVGISNQQGAAAVSVLSIDNICFDGTERSTLITADGQLWIGSSVSPFLRPGLLTSSDGTIAFTVGHGTIDLSAIGTDRNYTNVTHAMSPYTVLSTDYFLSVDCSAGAVTLNFPNAPTAKQTWVIKDRTGDAATNNITITTPGGTVTFDGATSYVMTANFQAINLIANTNPSYEVY